MIDLPIGVQSLMEAARKRFPDSLPSFTIRPAAGGFDYLVYELVISREKGWRVAHLISRFELVAIREPAAIADYITKTMLHQIEIADFVDPDKIFTKEEQK